MDGHSDGGEDDVQAGVPRCFGHRHHGNDRFTALGMRGAAGSWPAQGGHRAPNYHHHEEKCKRIVTSTDDCLHLTPGATH